jgi:transposase
MPNCNSANFQAFLDELSKLNPNEYKIVVLDNGAFHHAKTLIIPDNIELLFLPAYSPELNPAENMWAGYKRTFTNKLYNSLDLLSEFITQLVKRTTKNLVMSTCAFSYVFEGPFWTK